MGTDTIIRTAMYIGACLAISFILTISFGKLADWKNYGQTWVDYLLLLAVPFALWLVHGYTLLLIGMLTSLLLISITKKLGPNSKLVESFGLVIASVIAFLLGFRIQFIQPSFNDQYLYFTWFSLPITVAWLYIISKSVQFIHFELGRRKWKLFVITVIIVTTFFITLVKLQHTQQLQFSSYLGYGFIGALLAMLFISPHKKVLSALSLQFGFILASLAISGVVKSLTAFVLLVPIAPLILPTATKSLAFARVATRATDGDSLIEHFVSRYIRSQPMGIFLTYTSLSYLGLVLAWFLWNPGFLSFLGLLSSLVVLPATFLLGSRIVSYFDNMSPTLFNAGHHVNILGTVFDQTNLSRTSQKMETLSEEQGTSYVATPDVTAVVKAESDRFLRKSFSKADIVIPDGFGLIWASNVHGLNLSDRVAGIDLLEELFGSSTGLTVFLLGSAPGVAQEAAKNIARRYKTVDVVGTHHGYDPIDDQTVVDEINNLEPDLLLVGMGVPKQEKWIINNIRKVKANVVMGVGGSFDVISENLPRAPKAMRDNGLEWLYRIWLEPRRLWKARLIPYFMLRVIGEKIKLLLRDEIL